MTGKLLVIALIAASFAFAKDEGFAGKWIMDKSASTATAEIPDNLRQELKKKGSGYVIETSWREPRGGVAPLVLLGIMVTNFRLGPDEMNQVGPYMLKSQTTQNGNQLVTTWTAVNNDQNVKGQWTRTLSEDGKTMTLDIEQSSGGGQPNTGKLLFRRK